MLPLFSAQFLEMRPQHCKTARHNLEASLAGCQVRSSKQDQIHNSIVSTLLALMDGLDSRGQVVIIGATNRIDALDGALRRPGRCHPPSPRTHTCTLSHPRVSCRAAYSF